MMTLLHFVLSSSIASAACSLTDFDRTPPSAVSSRVSNQFATFEWASDVDTVRGRLWIWNYIWNQGNEGLRARWEKGRIRIPTLNPIPPREPFCNKYLVTSVQAQPDTDAPIVYGTNDQTQDEMVPVV
jgi:hypothetical protein